jgi:hypothetical protein
MDTLCLLLLMNLHSEIKVPEEKKNRGQKQLVVKVHYKNDDELSSLRKQLYISFYTIN